MSTPTCAAARFITALAILVMAGARCQAHPINADMSVAAFHTRASGIDVSLRIPAPEFVASTNVDVSALTGASTDKPLLEGLTAWLPQHFTVEAGGKTLTAEVVSAEMTADGMSGLQYAVLKLRYVTDRPATHLRVTSHLVHTIISSNGVQFELSEQKNTHVDFDTGASLANVVHNVVDFTSMGMEHLFSGPDHILFICTLIFALMDMRSVVKLLTGFTVGHSITLVLTTFNVFTVPPRLADACIALTIIVVGIENIVRKDKPKNRWLLVFCCGLVHGMGYSSALREVGLPEQGLVLCLLAFNIGIELAQIVIVTGIFPLLSRLRRYQELLTPGDGLQRYRVMMNCGSAATVSMGCYWLVQRVLSH